MKLIRILRVNEAEFRLIDEALDAKALALVVNKKQSSILAEQADKMIKAIAELRIKIRGGK